MYSLTPEPASRHDPAADDRSIVELIERAADKQSYCSCGRHTTAVWRDGVVWLECSSLMDPPNGRLGRLGRLVRTLSAATHVHESIVDLPAAEPEDALPYAA